MCVPDGKETRARAFQNSGTVDKDTVAVKGKKQGPDGRVKLDESRGFDLTINVPLQTCTCADLLALGRNKHVKRPKYDVEMLSEKWSI